MTVNSSDDHKAEFSDPFASMLGFQLRRSSVAVMAALAAELEPLEINPSEASLLMLVGANQGCTQSDLSRAMRAQPANLVPLINKLSVTGILQRAPGKGRAIALSLSERGEALYARVQQVFARHEARIGRGLPPERQAEIVAILRQICTNACHPDGDAA